MPENIITIPQIKRIKYLKDNTKGVDVDLSAEDIFPMIRVNNPCVSFRIVTYNHKLIT